MSQNLNKKLYVGSLPYSIDENELKELFASFGPIDSARVITDKFSGQSKGFGFVEMSNAEDAKKAAEGLNGKQIGGRTLVVNEARPEQPRERSFGGGNRWGGGGDNSRPRRPRKEYN